MSPRCVTIGEPAPTITVAPSASAYQFNSQCQAYPTGQLKYVVNNISKPVMVTSGGNLGTVKTRYFRYRYNCSSTNPGSCSDMEVFSLGYGVGLYDWKHYVQNTTTGTWTQVQDSKINNFSAGQTTPSLPCTSSYQ